MKLGADYSLRGLTFCLFCAKFSTTKAVMKTCLPGKILREDAVLV